MRIYGKIFVLILIFLTACSKSITSGSSSDIVKINKVISENTKASNVMMPHQKHEDAGVKCISCHHKNNNDERIKKCAECHQKKKGYETMHKLCLTCHREMNRGPKKCESCHLDKVDIAFDLITLPKTGHRKPAILFNHKSHAEKYGAKCIECHHTGSNENCANCHQARDSGNVISLKGAFHQQCHNCHRKTSGPKGCGKCHKKDDAKR
jgi:hypothetical protein